MLKICGPQRCSALRGPARTRRWCAVEHRVIDWAARPLYRGVQTSNHDRSCRPKRCMGRTEGPDLNGLRASLRLEKTLQRERNGALLEVHAANVLENCLTRADIVRERDFDSDGRSMSFSRSAVLLLVSWVLGRRRRRKRLFEVLRVRGNLTSGGIAANFRISKQRFMSHLVNRGHGNEEA